MGEQKDSCKPSDTIIMRGRCFADGDYCEVYALYSEDSDFKHFFTDSATYEKHAEHFQSKENKFISLCIKNENITDNVAEVQFVEVFEDLTCKPNRTIKYHTLATMVKEYGIWRILNEERALGCVRTKQPAD